MIPDWVAEFVGIPWKVRGRDREGADCWGLVRIALMEHYGIVVPSYDESYDDLHDGEWITALLRQGILSDGWHPVTDPREGDGVVLRIIGPLELHVGLVVAPGLFLHTMEKYGGSAVERLDHPMWAHRILGYYRHPEVSV